MLDKIMFLTADKRAGLASCAIMFLSLSAVASAADAVRAAKMDADKLAGVGWPAGEPFVAPEDVLEGNHRPRGETLHYGEELVVEIYEDDAATFRMDGPFTVDEFVQVLDGRLILPDAEGVSTEYVAGESLVVSKGFSGPWQVPGNYREPIVIDREACEQAYGSE